MKLSKQDLKWLHVEASSHCNAWCPACTRNNHGFGLSADLIEQDLIPEKLEAILLHFPNLEGIQLCGNFGDPVASKFIVDLVKISKRYVKKIQIHTNGSLRSVDWWSSFAKELHNIQHDVWFGIDGLAGVHEIYRQGTSFDKIIDNAKSFINAGGYATWQFIPYQHNEHQIAACMKMCYNLKFKKFHLARLYRQQTEARHWKSGEKFNLLPPTKVSNLIRMKPKQNRVLEENCMHLSMPSVYVSASGGISKCCYFYHHENFSTVEQMFDNYSLDLNDSTCVKNCG